jgi:hypothetical protein
MTGHPLCLVARCAIPGRHADGCANDTCRGCQRAQAADGLRLCRLHTERISRDAHTAAELWGELALRLLGGTGNGDRVSGTAERTRLPNPAAVEMRAEIRHVLASWCRLIGDERGWTLPADQVDAMAVYVARNAEWLAAGEYAGEVSDELDDLARRGRRLAYPSGARMVEVGPCVRDGCGGTVRAIMRPTDLLLPSELVCDVDDGHRWPPPSWRDYRRAVEKARAA